MQLHTVVMPPKSASADVPLTKAALNTIKAALCNSGPLEIDFKATNEALGVKNRSVHSSPIAQDTPLTSAQST